MLIMRPDMRMASNIPPVWPKGEVCLALCFGGKGEVWARALNISCTETDKDYQPSDDAFTLTTSHDGESVEDVMVYGLTNTSSGPQDFDRFLVLFVSPRAGLRAEVQKAIKSIWAKGHVP